MNNYESITNMTPRELARYLSSILSCRICPVDERCHNLCENELEQWLLSESEVSDENRD